MKTFIYAAAIVSSLAVVDPAMAQVTQQSFAPVLGQAFTQCQAPAVYRLSRGRLLTQGGWGFRPAGVDAFGNPVLQNAYTNNVYVARRRLVGMPYTYLEPIDGSGLAPCLATPGPNPLPVADPDR